MANITLNIEGDLNIYVSEEDGQPDSLYLDGMDGFPETLRIHLEADGEDDESKAEVIYAIPGAAAISMTLYEALTLALNSGGADSLALMPVSGIFIAFNSDDVIIDQNGDCYLAGPGIIFALEDGDIVSLDEEDKKLITQVLEDGTADVAAQVVRALSEERNLNKKLAGQLKQAEAQLTVALPKAAYFDALVDCPDCTGIRLTAKELGVPQSMFTAYLVRKKYAYYDSKGIMHPHALPYRNGLFVVREFIAPNGHRGTQMLVTPKGKQVFLAERAEIIG